MADTSFSLYATSALGAAPPVLDSRRSESTYDLTLLRALSEEMPENSTVHSAALIPTDFYSKKL